MKALRDPLLWLVALFVALLFLMPHSAALFNTLFRGYRGRCISRRALLTLPGASLAGGALQRHRGGAGVGAGIAVTRPAGREFRPLVETVAAIGQTFPPVAVLAIAVPVMGFGQQPAIIALILYGVLPVLQGTLAGVAAVPASVLSVAEGMGMSRWQRLRKVELPLAAPVIIAGIRVGDH